MHHIYAHWSATKRWQRGQCKCTNRILAIMLANYTHRGKSHHSKSVIIEINYDCKLAIVHTLSPTPSLSLLLAFASLTKRRFCDCWRCSVFVCSVLLAGWLAQTIRENYNRVFNILYDFPNFKHYNHFNGVWLKQPPAYNKDFNCNCFIITI